MNRISPEEVLRSKARELGLDPDKHSLTSVEGLAAALRRAAGYLSPCSAGTLVRAVLNPLHGLVEDIEGTRTKVEDILEALVANGDLLEQRDIAAAQERAGSLLYAAPPSFVVRRSGSVIVLGIAADHKTPLPSDLEDHVEYVGHVRRLSGVEPNALAPILREYGLTELTSDYWIRMPPVVSAQQHVATMDALLAKAPLFSSDVPGLTLLDSERPVAYYRGRWTDPKDQTGRFVGRRRQAYGADLWCYVELSSGRAQRLVDFPLVTSRHRGCDLAWYLQLAIDSVKKHPQRFAIETEGQAVPVVRFFSPIPQWAHRRLSAIGSPVEPQGCLIAYAVASEELEEERTFLREGLWLTEEDRKQTEGGTRCH